MISFPFGRARAAQDAARRIGEARARTASIEELVRDLSHRAGLAGKQIADIAGATDELTRTARDQADACSRLQQQVATVAQSNREIGSAARTARDEAEAVRAEVEAALSGTRVLVAAVSRVEQGIAAVNEALHAVSGAAAQISDVAFQTRLVAVSAAAEAARAGEAGRTFGVVAKSVAELAAQAQASSRQIAETLQHLGGRVRDLVADAERGRVGSGSSAAAAVDSAVAAFQSGFGRVQTHVGSITAAASGNVQSCEDALQAVTLIAESASGASASVQGAKARIDQLLSFSEGILQSTAAAGIETEDTPFLILVQSTSQRIGQLFEEALESRRIGLADLFDEQYRPIAGSDPQQFLTRFTALTDELLPPVQEPALNSSPLVLFCATVDRNGYLPTHNLKYSQPQRPGQTEWNTAHCRNRRIFDDRTGLAAARNQKPFLLQTYRRDMGGTFVLMKDLSAPIRVRGKHWGSFRMGYRFGETE